MNWVKPFDIIQSIRIVKFESVKRFKVFSENFLEFEIAMEPLVTTRLVLTWLWMYSEKKNSSKWKNIVQLTCGQFCLISQLLSFAGTTAFVIKFASVDLEKSLLTFMFVSGHFNAVFSITQAMISRNKITQLFDRLSNIYRTSKFKCNKNIDFLFILFFPIYYFKPKISNYSNFWPEQIVLVNGCGHSFSNICRFRSFA